MKFSRNVILLIIVIVIGIVLILFSTNKKEITENFKSSLVNQNNSSQSNNANSFIESLRQREFAGGEITIEQTLSKNSFYTKYLISYASDDLKIYGVMNVPAGNGPFPVIILNHGYFNSSTFSSGDGTDTMANILARNGYFTLASDYRGFGKSENEGEGSRGHNPNYAIDVLNLITSVKSLPKADESRIGIWSHSMGGEVSLRTAEATDKLKAIVLWAPTSANTADNTAFYGRGRNIGSPTPAGNQNIDGTSPINYLQYINVPISLHQGLADTEVNPQWSKNLYNALRKEGKKVEYFEYKGQDHNFRNLGWDEISQRTLEFFDRYLK